MSAANQNWLPLAQTWEKIHIYYLNLEMLTVRFRWTVIYFPIFRHDSLTSSRNVTFNLLMLMREKRFFFVNKINTQLMSGQNMPFFRTFNCGTSLPFHHYTIAYFWIGQNIVLQTTILLCSSILTADFVSISDSDLRESNVCSRYYYWSQFTICKLACAHDDKENSKLVPWAIQFLQYGPLKWTTHQFVFRY